MHAYSRPSARPQHWHAPLHAPYVAPMFWHLLDKRFKVPNILAIWMLQRTTKMPENMKETAACDTLSWPLPLCVKDALQHHGTSARLASTGRPTARCPTHLTAHKARADGHQIILGRGRGGVLVAGTTKVRSRDAGANHGASGDLLVQEARSSPPAPLHHCRRPGRCRRAMRRIQRPHWRPCQGAPLRPPWLMTAGVRCCAIPHRWRPRIMASSTLFVGARRKNGSHSS